MNRIDFDLCDCPLSFYLTSCNSMSCGRTGRSLCYTCARSEFLYKDSRQDTIKEAEGHSRDCTQGLTSVPCAPQDNEDVCWTRAGVQIWWRRCIGRSLTQRHQPDPYLSTPCAATMPADTLAEVLITRALDKGCFTKTPARRIPQYAVRGNRPRRRPDRSLSHTDV